MGAYVKGRGKWPGGKVSGCSLFAVGGTVKVRGTSVRRGKCLDSYHPYQCSKTRCCPPLSRRVVDRERIRYPPNRPWPPFPTGDRYFYNLLLDRKPTMMFSSNRIDFTFNKTLRCFGLDVNTLHGSAAVTAERRPEKKKKINNFVKSNNRPYIRKKSCRRMKQIFNKKSHKPISASALKNCVSFLLRIIPQACSYE